MQEAAKALDPSTPIEKLPPGTLLGKPTTPVTKPSAKLSKPRSPKPSKASRSAKPTPSKKKATKKPTTAAKAKPTKRSAAGKASKGVATTTRSGKKIRRAKAGGKGVLAAKGVHALVVRVPAAVHKQAWAKARKSDLPLNSWLLGVIARAAK